MPNSNAGQRDPSALGQVKYDRKPLDFYPTPPKCVDALFEIIGDDIPGFLLWEPCCGDGAISTKLLETDARDVLSTDIAAYESENGDFQADALIDFFSVTSLKELEPICDFVPDAIITNPPYGKTAKKFVEHALTLLAPEKGFLAVLMRHEWDASRGNAALCEIPAFAAKVTLKFRPRWIKPVPGEKQVSPRFPYAWYIWDFSRVGESGRSVQPDHRYAG